MSSDAPCDHPPEKFCVTCEPLLLAATIAACEKIAGPAAGASWMPEHHTRHPWAASGDQPDQLWILRFNDTDQQEMTWRGPSAERDAKAAYRRYSPAWTCELLATVPMIDHAASLLAARAQAAEAFQIGVRHQERANAAEQDRDDLLKAIGFKPGPLREHASRIVILLDATALRPAMVEARRQRDAAEGSLLHAQAYAAEEIRAWCKERFGKWITHKTADTLRRRIFGTKDTA